MLRMTRATLLMACAWVWLAGCGESTSPNGTAISDASGDATTGEEVRGDAPTDVGDAPEDGTSDADTPLVLDVARDTGATQDVPDSTAQSSSDADVDATRDVEAEGDAEADVPPAPDALEPPEDAGPPPPLKVLFIGNSYTSVNNLSAMVAALATDTNVAMTTDAIVKGGAWLEHHASNPATMESIATGGWTHVVLQEQSYLAVPWPLTFLTAAAILSDAIHAAGAVPVFFETWARAEGSSLYEEDLAGYSPETMQAALKAVYELAASENSALYSPVGDAWQASLAAHPNIALHSSDKSHPAPAGSHLAACVFLEVLSGQNPEAAEWVPNGVSSEDGALLASIAHAVVEALDAP